MKKLNLKGFGLIEALLILIALVLVGSVGWYIYDSNQDTINTDEEVTQVIEDSSKYMYIADWDVSIGINEFADMIDVSEPEDTFAGARSSLSVTVKKEFSPFADCDSYISITRLKDVSEFDTEPEIKVGEYYYYNSGVSECSGASPSDNEVKISTTDLREAFDNYGVRE